MSEHLLPGSPPIVLNLRRSSRARRISLRVSHLDGRITLTLPNGVPEAEGMAFAEAKMSWLHRHMADRPQDKIIEIGQTLPVEGRLCRLEETTKRQVCLQGDTLFVPKGNTGARVQAWLKTLARERLAAASDIYAAQLGRRYAKLTLRDTRSRWGSCSSRGGLMYSWRLVMAPPEVLHYVAAHEVAHLQEMNHSQAFWRLVEALFGAYEAPRSWLRNEGNALHLYRF